MKKIILIVVGLIILLIVILVVFQMVLGSKKQNAASSGPVVLTYWGLWEDDKIMKPVIDQFQKENPNITINYVRSSSQNYRTRAITQIKAGQGPDVFRIHNTWLIDGFSGLLSPAPTDVFSVKDYQNTFYPVASDSFVRNGQIFAAPMEVDGLALFYNEDILSGVGMNQLPKDWNEFFNDAVALTVIDPTTNQIKTAGAAMGTTGNVDHWSDILGLLLMQQPGVKLDTTVNSSAVAEVFSFYKKFVNNPQDPKKQVWNDQMPPSTQAFAQGKVAFYFAPSWRASELRVINPKLNFKIAPVPQLTPQNPAAWATFWAEAVPISSKHPKEAWQFIKYLTSKEAENIMYREAAKVRLFGEPYSRIDLRSQIASDPLAGAFVNQAQYYKSWYLASSTLDQGIDDQIIKYFEDGMNRIVVKGEDPTAVLPTVDAGVKQVFADINKPAAPVASKKP